MQQSWVELRLLCKVCSTEIYMRVSYREKICIEVFQPIAHCSPLPAHKPHLSRKTASLRRGESPFHSSDAL